MHTKQRVSKACDTNLGQNATTSFKRNVRYAYEWRTCEMSSTTGIEKSSLRRSITTALKEKKIFYCHPIFFASWCIQVRRRKTNGDLHRRNRGYHRQRVCSFSLLLCRLFVIRTYNVLLLYKIIKTRKTMLKKERNVQYKKHGIPLLILRSGGNPYKISMWYATVSL